MISRYARRGCDSVDDGGWLNPGRSQSEGAENVHRQGRPSHDGAAPASPCPGLDRFGLCTDDLDAGLKAKGVGFTMELREIGPGTKICFIVAPRNVSLALLQRR